MVREFFVKCDLADIALQEWGAVNTPPVIAIHGWLDNSSSFAPFANSCPALRIIAPDLPGHGHSGHLAPFVPYSLENYATTLLSLVKKLQLKSFSLVCHSLGASIGLVISAAMPTLVKNLILIDSVGPPIELSDKDSMSNLLENVFTGHSIHSSPPTRYPTMDAAIEVRRIFSNLPTEVASLITKRDIRQSEDNTNWTSRVDRRLLPSPYFSFTENQFHHLINHVQCPTTLIHGTDGRVQHQLLNKRRLLFKSLEVFELSGGHHIHAEKPLETAKIIMPLIFSEGKGLEARPL